MRHCFTRSLCCIPIYFHLIIYIYIYIYIYSAIVILLFNNIIDISYLGRLLYNSDSFQHFNERDFVEPSRNICGVSNLLSIKLCKNVTHRTFSVWMLSWIHILWLSTVRLTSVKKFESAKKTFQLVVFEDPQKLYNFD